MHSLLNGIRHFAYEHDEMPAFHAAYLILAVLSAMIFNLGAFGMLVLAHMALDTVKYRERHHFTWKQTAEGVVRESLIDVTLLFVGLVFSVYLHHTVGVSSLAGLMRAEITVIRLVALAVPKIKILHHFLKIMAHLHSYMEQVHPRHGKGWSSLDRICFAFCGISVLLIVLASQLMHVDPSTIQGILVEELVPWHL
tara:strand:+ start:163 stop:750 length:588 start_codon:yes stop_codon:yes gene_type:complete